MKSPKIGTRGAAILAFCLGVVVSFVGPPVVSRMFKAATSDIKEELRVSSPTGEFDAVMTRESYGGAAGGFEWRVYIVRKGKPAPSDISRALFTAGELTGEKLIWVQAHLLEVHFDIAEIEEFRNLWGLYEIENVGPTGEHDYLVEVKLAPSSPDFSRLTPDGGFQRTY